MSGKVARAFRHYSTDTWNGLKEEEKQGISWRQIYRAMKKGYKESKRRGDEQV